ncbi:alanyl-tRNA synthetase [Providencia sp.]
MQNNIYLTNTYQYEIETTLLEQGNDNEGYWIALKDNIFHPQGGGQPTDTAWVNNEPVRIKKQSDGLIIAYVPNGVTFSPSETLTASIDGEKRRRYAALHTAGHLLNWELRRFGWLAQKGHHFPDESRVEFCMMEANVTPFEQLDSQHIEDIVNQSINSSRTVEIKQNGTLRTSYIDQTEEMPCGGTHVSSLNCIAHFSIKSMKLKKGVLRISYDAQHISV